MSDLLILTSKQKEELNKAVIQYLKPQLTDESNPNVLSELMKVLKVEDNSTNNIIPNYLEKKWSTVLRLQKRIMDLENDINNMKAIMESQPDSYVQSTDKINWTPSTIKQTFKTQSNQQVTTVSIHPYLPIILCGCSDGSIFVWNLAMDDTTPEKIIKAHTRSINKIVWSKLPIDFTGNGSTDYVFASCSSDLSIKIWSSSYKQIRNLMGHEHTVSSIEFSTCQSNILYSVSRDRNVKVWNIVNANCLKSFIGHSEWVRQLDVASVSSSNMDDNNKFGDFLLTCSNDQSIRLSHADSGTGLSLLVGHGHVVEDVKFLPLHSNGFIDKFLDKNLARFSSIPKTLIKEELYIKTLGFKYCVSCGRDNNLKLWLLPPPVIQPHRLPLPSNLNNSQGWLIDTMVGHTSWVKNIVVHPNGRFIFSCGDDKTIKIWDLEPLAEDGKVKCIKTLSGHDGFVTSINMATYEMDDKLPSFENQEKLLKYIEGKMRCVFISGGVDNTVRLWR